MSGVLGHRFGRNIRPEGAGQFGKVCAQFVGRMAPREIGIRLAEPDLGQTIHNFGTGECFRQEDHFGVSLLDFAYQPFPEAVGLGVRVVDAENPHPLCNPEHNHAEQFLVESLPVVCFKVERDYVLINLGRVFGMLDRPVRPAPEPPGVFFDPGMIGRTLESQVESNLDARFACLTDEIPEVIHGAELRMDGGMSSFV